MTSAQSTEGQSERDAGSLRELYRTWRVLFWLFGIVGLVLIFYAEENWRGHWAWEHYMQRMTAQGEVFNPAVFIPPRVPDEQNFTMTPALAPLFEFVPGTQKWLDPNAPRLFDDLTSKYNNAAGLVKSHSSVRQNSWVHYRTDLGAWAAAFSPPMDAKGRKKQPLLETNFSSQDAATKVLNALSDFKPVLDEFREASSRPYSRFNLRYEQDDPAAILLPHLANIKHFCQVLQLRASASLALGRTDDALQDLVLMFYLIDTTRDEPIIISQLVRMAEIQLAFQPLAEGMGQWSQSQLRELQQHLQHFDFCADVRHSLQAERVLFGGGEIDYVRRSHNKIRVFNEFDRFGESNGSTDFLPAGILFATAPSGWLDLEELNLSRIYDQYLLPIIDLTNRVIKPDAVVEAETGIAKATQGTSSSRVFHHKFFAALMLPALSKVSEKTAYAQTAVDTASVACALERYRLARGQLPDSLERLLPDFMTALPHDIINGKPLLYRPSTIGGHYLLYSVGWNQTDEGGVVHNNKSGETDQNKGDWVWTDRF
jgi:hypothetical protein